MGYYRRKGHNTVSSGLATTIRLLSKTDNEAAVRVLTAALDSPNAPIKEGALSALLKRRSPTGGREILRRIPDIPVAWKEIIRQHHGAMTRAIRDALLGSDRRLCLNACRALVWFREYDLMPTLLNLLEDRQKEKAQLAAETLTELIGQLYEQLAGPRDYADRRDPQMIRRHVLGSLELSLKRFNQHKRREVVEAFLILVGRDNVVLKQILTDPHHSCFVVTVDLLSKSKQGGVIRLLLSFLDDPHTPSAALSIIANRHDLKFVNYLLRKIGRDPSATARQNLKRLETIGWLKSAAEVLDELDDAAQYGAVRLVMTSGVSRIQAYSVVEYLLLHGRPGGRRAAAEALAEFHGADANALAVRALDDADPQVQAQVVSQLRSRGIPGVLLRLIDLIDSPHAEVRHAVRESLAEFTFPRYLAAFDELDDEVRRSTGALVRKVDQKSLTLLRAELVSQVRGRRMRGLGMARAMDAVGAIEETIVAMLNDEDHLVRAEAAASLTLSSSEASRRALERALDDSSQKVREVAQKSLQNRMQFHQWRETLADPRD